MFRWWVSALAVAGAALFTLACFVYDDLPFPEADRLVIWEDDSDPRIYLTPGDWPGHPYFERIAAYTDWEPALSGDGGSERVPSLKVTPGFFRVLGLQTLLGRILVADETGEVLIGSDLWRRIGDESPTIIGQTLWLDGQPQVVVGVLPDFPSFPHPDIQLWTPLKTPSRPVQLSYLGRLKAGESFDAAAQAMAHVRLQRLSVLFDAP